VIVVVVASNQTNKVLVLLKCSVYTWRLESSSVECRGVVGQRVNQSHPM